MQLSRRITDHIACCRWLNILMAKTIKLKNLNANHPATPISSPTSAAAISADRDCVAVALTAGISNETGI
jgi:hypothetical protein